jgi:hypothetical protein
MAYVDQNKAASVMYDYMNTLDANPLGMAAHWAGWPDEVTKRFFDLSFAFIQEIAEKKDRIQDPVMRQYAENAEVMIQALKDARS